MRRLFAGVFTVLALMGAAGAAHTEDARYFKIATAGTGGSYFPVGTIIATATSTPGLVVNAVASNGSFANVEALAAGSVDSAFVQADVAHWAVTGTGAFEAKGKREGLRAIAALYPEAVHLVVRRASGIASFADLAGHHVAIDEPGSGTLVDVRLILAAHGLSERDFTAEYFKPDLAAQMVAAGQLDGFFYVGGTPDGAIAALAAKVAGGPAAITLVPINGSGAQGLMADNPFFTAVTIPTGAYQGVAETHTVAVRALWLTTAATPDDVVEAITASLFSEATLKALAAHPQGAQIGLATAQDGLTVPLHPGAKAFYAKAGILK